MSRYQTVLETEKPRKKVATGLWSDIRNVADSSNAIARTVHARSSRRWTEAEETTLKEAFEAAVRLSPAGYRLGSNKERKAIIRQVAIKTQRSPKAVQIRLGALGVDLTRNKAVPAKDVRAFIQSSLPR